MLKLKWRDDMRYDYRSGIKRERTKTKSLLAQVLMGVMLVSALAFPAVAAKTNDNGALKIAWNLSGSVMPVPPYGSADLPGSETASKLIVNTPNGKVKANITGAMNGLTPNTTYTVFLSKSYTPYSYNWNIGGNYNIAINSGGTDYVHNASVNQSVAISGTLVYPGYTKVIDSGTVIGDQVTINAHYEGMEQATLTLTGTINNDGSMTGEWTDTYYPANTRTGTWSTPTGAAHKVESGNISWPGLLNVSIKPFTFDTDAYGSGSWHINLKADDINGATEASIWINGAGKTILISDTFNL